MANEFTELVAWQRADELERFMLEIIKRPSVSRDKEFCEQTSGAAGSAPRNIAEGFGRFAPIQFANFLRIAIGSEKEKEESDSEGLAAWRDHRRGAQCGLIARETGGLRCNWPAALQPIAEGSRERQENRRRLRSTGG